MLYEMLLGKGSIQGGGKLKVHRVYMSEFVGHVVFCVPPRPSHCPASGMEWILEELYVCMRAVLGDAVRVIENVLLAIPSPTPPPCMHGLFSSSAFWTDTSRAGELSNMTAAFS